MLICGDSGVIDVRTACYWKLLFTRLVSYRFTRVGQVAVILSKERNPLNISDRRDPPRWHGRAEKNNEDGWTNNLSINLSIGTTLRDIKS